MNKYILIHPNPRKNPDNTINAKTYPWEYWEQFVSLFKQKYPDIDIYCVGLSGDKPINGTIAYFDLPLAKIKSLAEEALLVISVDSFLQHLLAKSNKPMIVLWGPSNPEIFGYDKNINLYVDKKYFRPDPYGVWQIIKWNKDAFILPEKIMDSLEPFIRNI
jgi:ADP-heptose:LPS heptosyltransferase